MKISKEYKKFVHRMCNSFVNCLRISEILKEYNANLENEDGWIEEEWSSIDRAISRMPNLHFQRTYNLKAYSQKASFRWIYCFLYYYLHHK